MSQPTQQERPIIIIDAFNNFIRHFLVNQEINLHSQPVGGVVGFLKSVDYLVGTFCPSRVYVVWENGGPSQRRKHISPEYKANRAKMKEVKKIQQGKESIRDVLALDDQTRVQQITMLTALLKSTPVCQIYVQDTECDDIIAYLAQDKLRNVNAKKIIVSNDKDFYQLLHDPTINIYDPATRKIIVEKDVLEKFGISARNFCLAKTIAGDDSDNVAGVPGAGFKTVSKRFPKMSHGDEDVTISDIITEARDANKGKKKPIAIYDAIAQNETLLRRNWELMYLNSSSLSASQINKINYIVESHEPRMDKLGLIKTVIECGINATFDYDRFCSQMRNFIR
jgi:5'-3' exonuclease